MHFLVVGCGSIGERHIKNLLKLGHHVTGCDTDRSRLLFVKKRYGIDTSDDLNKALAKRYDGALICGPTSLHVPIAKTIAQRNIHLFIEKPLSNSLEGVHELSRIVDRNRLIVLVGCNIRFMKGFKFVRQLIAKKRIGRISAARIECGYYLPRWHPNEDYTKSYSARRELGGGAIFDDIHEIDSLYWLFGYPKEVFCNKERASKLKINTEDMAQILLRFRSNILAQIHLDYLQPTYRRSYEFIGAGGVIQFDLRRQEVKLYGKREHSCRVYKRQVKENENQMFVNEMKHFIRCIKGKEASMNDLASAAEVLEVALACHTAAERKRVVYL